MPESPLLVELAIALPVALVVAYLIALLMRRLFGRRLRLTLAVLTIVSLLGLSAGLFVAGWFFSGLRLWMPTTILLAFSASLVLSLLVSVISAVLHDEHPAVDIPALLAAGESDRVEFKETARWNVREDRKDARMELAVAKTLAAFLNASGGTLVIGADDAGRAVGLDRDFATLRTPDADRFELWLRDLLTNLLGRNAAGLPRIAFGPGPNGVVVCAVTCSPSPRPVFLSQAKDGSSTDLWVRVGNSTRSLGVDEAVEYVSRHWRPSLSTVLLGRPAGR